MPRHRKDGGRIHGALRGEGGSRRSVLPRFRPGHLAAHAQARAPRAAAPDGAGPGRAAAWRRCLGLARLLMVTPWFAAGAGIVIAAALAVDSPSSLTYAPSGPGVRCAETGCTGTAPGRGPDLATATPGVPITGGAAPGEGPKTGPAGPGPVYQVGYELLRRWPSGFLAMISLPANIRPGAWSLQFTFASARVDRVWGARWQPFNNGNGGTATGPSGWGGPGPGGDGGGGPGWGGGAGGGSGPGHLGSGQLTVSATGTPATPSGCTLDGKRCRFG
jgi:hypothetical protein